MINVLRYISTTFISDKFHVGASLKPQKRKTVFSKRNAATGLQTIIIITVLVVRIIGHGL